MQYEITAEMNLKNFILELREDAQALNECADVLPPKSTPIVIYISDSFNGCSNLQKIVIRKNN